MRNKTSIPFAFLLALTLAVLTGCHRDCGCCGESVPAVAESAPKTASASSPAPAPVESTAPAAPQVAGKWIGTWESIGHKGHGGGLRCEATEAGAGKWEAVFTAEYGPTKSYNVKLEGKLSGAAVLFGGKVDLGRGDGGVFTWTGEATQTAFKGKYEGGGDTGSFQMVRAAK
jgi:hypothetical protein